MHLALHYMKRSRVKERSARFKADIKCSSLDTIAFVL